MGLSWRQQVLVEQNQVVDVVIVCLVKERLEILVLLRQGPVPFEEQADHHQNSRETRDISIDEVINYIRNEGFLAKL